MKVIYKLPPRTDNKITTNGPAATTKRRLVSWKTISKFIILRMVLLK